MLGTMKKAIAGGLATIATTAVTGSVIAVSVPADVTMPWYGYIVVGLVNAAIGFAIVYLAPKNIPNA